MVYYSTAELFEARRRETQYAYESACKTLLELGTEPVPSDPLAASIRGMLIALAYATITITEPQLRS